MQDKKVEINSQLIRIARIFSFPHKKIIENENSDQFIYNVFWCWSVLVRETKNDHTTFLSE